MAEKRTRTMKSREIVRDPENPKKFVAKVTTSVYNFDMVLREWDRQPQKTVTFEPLNESKDGYKSLSLKICEIRQAFNQMLEPISAKFIRDVKIKVDDDYESVVLTTANGHVFLNDLTYGMTRELSMIEIFRGQQGLKITIGKPHKVSDQKLADMIKNKEVFPVPISVIGEGQNLDVRLNIPYNING